MPIPFGKVFPYGTFLQYLRSPELTRSPADRPGAVGTDSGAYFS